MKIEKMKIYDKGFQTGYCGSPPKFTSVEKDTPFAKGYRAGKELREKIDTVNKSEDSEMLQIINQRKIKLL